MNKFKTTFLAILGGIDTVITMFTPIILGTIWLTISIQNWFAYFFFILGLISTIYRAIKIGWLK